MSHCAQIVALGSDVVLNMHTELLVWELVLYVSCVVITSLPVSTCRSSFCGFTFFSTECWKHNAYLYIISLGYTHLNLVHSSFCDKTISAL